MVLSLARHLEKTGGRGWEHFATGLGKGLEKYKVVRVRQGEVDTIEQEMGGNIVKIVRAVMERFEDRCLTSGVELDMVEHIASLLECGEVFDPPLRVQARALREERSRGGAHTMASN